MTTGQATAQVFWTAFKALPKNARENFLERLVVDRQFRRELEDRLDNEAADRALGETGRVRWETLKKKLDQ